MAFLVSIGMLLAPQAVSATGVAGGTGGNSLAILMATSYPAIESVVIQHPLANFTAAVPGPSNGPLTASELGALSSNPQQAEDRFNALAYQQGFGAYLRLWTDILGPGKGANDIVVTLYRIPNSSDAASFASGSQQPYQPSGAASSFSVPSIPGAHGYTISITSPTRVTEQVVLFRSGPYVAIVQLASSTAANNSAALNPSDAIAVSFQQYVATQHSLGVDSTGSPPTASTSGSNHGSRLPKVLAIIGGLVALAAIGWLATGRRRNRRRRRRTSLDAVPRETDRVVATMGRAGLNYTIRPVRGPMVEADADESKLEPAFETGLVEPVAGPVAETEEEPVIEPVAVLERVVVPVLEPNSEPVIEPVFQPVLADSDEVPIIKPVFEPVKAQTADEHENPPVIEPAFDPAAVFKSVSEPVIEPAFEPIFEPVIEHANVVQTTIQSPERANTGTAATPVGRLDEPVPGTLPAWLPGPSGSPDVIRYWDGESWTSHVATRSAKR